MIVLKARNANQALPEMMYEIAHSEHAVQRGSRNGPVIQFVEPFTIQYMNPLERVVFWGERDANPFFHLFESLWMLGGRNDVAYVKQFSSQMGQFSDDGRTFHGAYGHRWRQHWTFDQVGEIIKALKDNAENRRCNLQMWDPQVDSPNGKGKDYPCNLSAVFNRNHAGALNMVVYNRSNDILWGALGANCVHFSILQEYIAAGVGCPVGQYWQVSANMHGYTELNPVLNRCRPLGEKAFPSQQYRNECPYQNDHVDPYPLVSRPLREWDEDLRMFLEQGDGASMGYRDPFFRRVAVPMLVAYRHFQNKSNEGRFTAAINAMRQVMNCDWKLAGLQWLERREIAAKSKIGL